VIRVLDLAMAMLIASANLLAKLDNALASQQGVSVTLDAVVGMANEIPVKIRRL